MAVYLIIVEEVSSHKMQDCPDKTFEIFGAFTSFTKCYQYVKSLLEKQTIVNTSIENMKSFEESKKEIFHLEFFHGDSVEVYKEEFDTGVIDTEIKTIKVRIQYFEENFEMH